MSEWQNLKLGELVTLHYGKALKAQDRIEGDIPVYSSAGITGYHNEALVESEAIVIGRKGSVGTVYKTNGPFCCIDTAYYILPEQQSYNFTYLFYLLQTLGLHELNEDSAVPGLNRQTAYDQDLLLPTLPEQKAIADVLSALDDKIDLLQRQNETLEKMAETLFRQWFIEEAKEDWKEVTVGDFVKLNSSSINKNYAFGEILYLDTGSLTKGVVSALQPYNVVDAPSRAKRLVQHEDILISTVRPNQLHYGLVHNPQENLVVSTGFCTITSEKISPYFIYLLLTSEEMTEYLHSIAEGSTSTYPSLKPEDIGAVRFNLPDQNLLKEFHILAKSQWKKIHKNYQQIQTLQNLRDTLLPKLMSGEVRVKLD